MGYVTKDQLKTPRVAEGDVTLVTGGMVRVRGLSRAEMVELSRAEAKDHEMQVVHAALVQPEGMSLGDVKAWFKAAPSRELTMVYDKVLDLSGHSSDNGQAAYKSVSGQPDA